jgi:hypothetical protein
VSLRRELRVGIIAVAAAATVAVVVGGVLLSQPSGVPEPAVTESAGTPASPAPLASAAAPEPEGSPAPEGSAGPGEGETGETGPGDIGADADVPGGTGLSEGAPEATGPGGTGTGEAVPGSEPPPAPPALVTLPLPASSTATGSLVSGFPVQVIPEVPTSVIESSSVAVEGSRLQAALSGQTTLAAEAVVAFYSAELAELGMNGAPAAALDGSTAVTFTRDDNSVALTVIPVDGGSRYAVFGTFTAES